MAKYWFRKRKGLLTKDLGWGWIPISWQGWLVVAVMLLVIIGSIIFITGPYISLNSDPPVQDGYLLIAIIVITISLGAYISYRKTRR